MTTDLETLSMLRDTLNRYGLEQYTFQDRQRYLDQPGGFSEEAWDALTEFGFLGLCLDEVDGGIDADATTVGALMEVVGSRLMQEPFLFTAVLAARVLKASEEKQDYLGDLQAGRSVFACALDCGTERDVTWNGSQLSGDIICALHGDVANFLLAAVDNGMGHDLVIVDLSDEGVKRSPYRLVDGRGAANIRLDHVDCIVLNFKDQSADQLLDRIMAQGAVALCAEALGVTEALIRQTNDYLKVRKQFGKPLGANQSLQHRMADLYMLQQEAIALTRAAETAIDERSPRTETLVSAAKAWAGRTVQQVANEAVQMHGGLGITEELEISHYFRRTMVLNTLFGSRDEHMMVFARNTLDQA